ncbi:MAG: hypothetical protein AVDCRST_MAG19-3445, partial [uncultured Thermomicrobiales bacterium]
EAPRGGRRKRARVRSTTPRRRNDAAPATASGGRIGRRRNPPCRL